MADMKANAVTFTAPYTVEVRDVVVSPPAHDHLLVNTQVSAVSAGTEMLFYRGQVPADLPIDSAIASLAGQVKYPLHYGYACVGEIAAVGPNGDPDMIGRSVFAFHPHASRFTVAPTDVVELPLEMDAEQASLLPNMETAVSLLMDAAPLIGERVLVFGQGIVGLLVTFLLAQMPLSSVATVEPLAERRRLSLALGASAAISPDELAGPEAQSSDLIVELSGNPSALDQAVRAAGYGTRIVVGSWYGTKPVELALGGRFHRNRNTLLSSQVSTIPPALTGRWTKRRRLLTALRSLQALPYRALISHRLPVTRSPEAYRLLDQNPGEVLQVLLTY